MKTNIVHDCSSDEAAANYMAEQLMTLYLKEPSSRTSDALLRYEQERQHVHFGDSVFEGEEADTMQSHVEAAFSENYFETHYIPTSSKTYDCSHIHFANALEHDSPLGFCVDIGAPRSVIGKSELAILLKHLKRNKIPRMTSSNSFRFGDVTVKSLGMIEIPLATPSHVRNISVLMDIVPVGVPALFGLDVLDAEHLYADNVTNRLVHREVLSINNELLK